MKTNENSWLKRNLFLVLGVSGGILFCCAIALVAVFSRAFKNPLSVNPTESSSELRPNYYGVFVQQDNQLIELQQKEIFSLPTEGEMNGAYAVADAEPVIVVWRAETNLDYLELYKLNQYLGESKSEIPYRATPKDEGVIEITFAAPLQDGVYCLIQGDPLAAMLPGWCFKIGNTSQSQAVETLPVGGGQGQATSGCFREDVFCVGLVTDVGKVNDRSFNQLAWEGVQLAEKELGAQVQYIETTDARDYDQNIALFASDGYDVIVTVGFGMGEATISAAQKHPNVKFIGVDQIQTQAVQGVAGLTFPEDQAGFLAGALAAMMSETHVIGAVCGTDVVPPVWRFGEGYRSGASYGDTKKGTTTRVLIEYHNDVGFDKTFTDPEWGAATAKSMMQQDADVIFGCGGITGNGALLAAAEAGKYAIGVDTDQYYTLPEAAPRMLSSAMKLITPGVFDLIKLAKDGNFPSGNYAGFGGLAPFHDLESEVSEAMKTIIKEIDEGLRQGSIQTNVSPTKP